jgi:hypothetical protein
MTLFEKCVEAAMDAEVTLGPADAKAITRAVLETIRDHTPSPRTVDEMCRVLGEELIPVSPLTHVSVSAQDAGGPLPSGVTFDGKYTLTVGTTLLAGSCSMTGHEVREWLANSNPPPISNTAPDPLPPRIGPDCEVVVGEPCSAERERV